MKENLRLICVLAHPDDESLGMGGTLAKYASEGIETYLVTATRGERGWFGDEKDNPGMKALGKIREAELLNAAQELSIREVNFFDYIDGDLRICGSMWTARMAVLQPCCRMHRPNCAA